MGRKHARALELERLQQWRQSMGQAWLDKPKDVYKWMKNDYQAPLVMLKDPETGGPTANVNRMDEILHESRDKVMRKYADSPEPDPDGFVQKYRSFIESNTDMDATPLTGARLRKRFGKMGVHTATSLDGWCVADLLCLPNALFDMLAQLLTHIESTGLWPRVLARGFVSLIRKGKGMLPMQQRPLSVLSQLYRVWAGVRLEECMIWQEKWVHPHAYGFRKKRGAPKS